MAKVLVIGSGGREHALAWALSRSPQVDQVFVAPGNGGTDWPAASGEGWQPRAACASVPIAIDDHAALIAFAQRERIDLTVIGPEAPLAAGIVDEFQEAGLAVFGPRKAAALVEASKAFSKDLMTEQGIPTAEYFVTSDLMEARRFLQEYRKPLVVKADGLAAGKGVIVCDTREEAGEAIHAMLQDQIFGEASRTIILEERLTGREFSVLAFCDGQRARVMPIARDHKRIFDGDRGLNTGGMGAFAPAQDIDPQIIAEVEARVLQPALDGFNALGTPYVGVLFAGLMLTPDEIKTLEFNCRFGDPETEVILPLLRSDLYAVMQACVQGTLDQFTLEWSDDFCATVIAAAPGYPEAYPKGLPINGLEQVSSDEAIIFHAGTQHREDQIVTSGGRVLAATARGAAKEVALEHAYATLAKVRFEGMHYRRDIGRTS